ncbi:Uncharacterised protein [Streptococcus pneumoniae]|nr:Uncharacterised protein [Streptococcus pneumoniae]
MKMTNTVATNWKEALACDTVKEFISVFDDISTDTIATADTVKNQGNFIPFLGSLFPSIRFRSL